MKHNKCIAVLKYNNKRIVSSWTTYLAMVIIVLGGIFTLQRNMLIHNLQYLNPLGALNMFLYSNIVDNVVVPILAPLIPVLIFVPHMYDDMQKERFVYRINQEKPALSFSSNVVCSALYGGGIFVFVFLIQLLIMIIIDPAASPMIEFRSGIFSMQYTFSMLLYCICFIIHGFVFGAVYGLLGAGICLHVKEKIWIYIIPILVYCMPAYFINLFPAGFAEASMWFIPMMTFEISSINLSSAQNGCQLLVITAISAILLSMGYRKWPKNCK